MTVLVTVAGPGGEVDLELDGDCPVADLLPELALAVGDDPHAAADPGSLVLATADGCRLDGRTSLQEAGVLDGQRLHLHQAAIGTSSTAPGRVEGGEQTPPGDGGSGVRPGDRPVLPCYVVLDTSDSMSGAPLHAVNVELARLVDALRDDPRAADACRLAVVAFDAEAYLVTPLAGVDRLDPPHLAATRPATNYEAAFRFLRRQIALDLEQLHAEGRRPLRPAVVFLTDGRPTRGHWPPAHAELVDPGWEGSPDILAFGFADASELTVTRIGTAGAYLCRAPAPPRPPAPTGTSGSTAVLLSAVMTFLLEALGHPRAGLAVPSAAPAGWRSLRPGPR